MPLMKRHIYILGVLAYKFIVAQPYCWVSTITELNESCIVLNKMVAKAFNPNSN